jgi:hypothetical protein
MRSAVGISRLQAREDVNGRLMPFCRILGFDTGFEQRQ